jgi:ribonuclease J
MKEPRANGASEATATTKGELVFAALGGLGEIGMNAYLYGLGEAKARRWLMVDLGLTFPGDAEPGVDVVLPDLKFIAANRKQLAGLVLTHAHEDHIGAVIDLWPRIGCPIYATPFTAGMLRSKSNEFGNKVKLPITEVPIGGRFKVGPFDLEFVNLAHSIPEPSGLVLRTPHGNVFHTGDWKLDTDPLVGAPSDNARLKQLGEEGILAMVCDSTNALREGSSPSEIEVAASLAKVIKSGRRRVAVTTFASNVARIRAVSEAAEATGRKLVVVGRAMHRVIQVAIDTGYLPVDFKYLDQNQYSFLQPAETLCLCTGSQGEPRAALSRIAEESHPQVTFGRGDLVVYSSRTIPGNEKAVGRVQNLLATIGCNLVTDSDALVHVTGHPRREELRQMYAWIKPKIAIPMHGEARHMVEHAKLAKSCGVADTQVVTSGKLVRLAPGPAAVIDEIPVGRLYRDGRLIIAGGVEGPVRERRKLAVVGIVVVSMVLGRKGELIGEADCIVDGVPYETRDGDSMEDVVLDAVDGTLESIPPGRRKDVELVRDAVRRAVRAAVDQEWGKKPVVKVLINKMV